MDDLLQNIIKTLGGYAIFISALTWLLKNLLTHYINKDIEHYKVTLKNSFESQIENLKAFLQIENFQQQIFFSNIYERRSHIISKIYTKIMSINRTLEQCSIEAKSEINGILDIVSALKTANEEYNNLKLIIEDNMIIFSEKMCSQLSEYLDLLHNVLYHSNTFSGDWTETHSGNFLSSWRKIEKVHPNILKALTSEFRTLLGGKILTEKDGKGVLND